MSSEPMEADVTSMQAPTPVERSRARFWLLRIVLPGRWGRWLTGVVIFATLLSLFGLASILSPDGIDEVGIGVVLFFCVILAYIVPVHHLIVSRSVSALDALGTRFPALEQNVAISRKQLLHKSRSWMARTLAVGVAAGIGHNALLLGGSDPAVLTHPPTALTAVFTLLIWIIMTAAISSLIENAVLFARLGTSVPIELLHLQALTPFGSVAVSSTLAMIGAQAAFPLMFFQTDISYLTYVPGLVATAAPMIFLFVAPVWPVHRRIRDGKHRELDRIGRAIDTAAAGAVETPYDRVAPLLIYRREISDTGEWPFDTNVLGRLALYLIIPPLTWVGAALIEILVDTAL